MKRKGQNIQVTATQCDKQMPVLIRMDFIFKASNTRPRHVELPSLSYTESLVNWTEDKFSISRSFGHVSIVVMLNVVDEKSSYTSCCVNYQ